MSVCRNVQETFDTDTERIRISEENAHQ
jgi:hypothetical protein